MERIEEESTEKINKDNSSQTREQTVKSSPERRNEVKDIALDVSGEYVTLSSVLILMVITITITLGAVWLGAHKGLFNVQSNEATQRIVILDAERLMKAALRAQENNSSGSDVKADADRFQQNLKKEVDRLVANGYTVINYKAVIAHGNGVDVTDDVISRLGFRK